MQPKPHNPLSPFLVHHQPLPVLKALVLGQKGPLVEGEIERAKEYASKLALELKKLSFNIHYSKG
jgi:hypothetical protein